MMPGRSLSSSKTIPGNIGLVQLLSYCTPHKFSFKGTQHILFSMKPNETCPNLLRFSFFSENRNETIWLGESETRLFFEFMSSKHLKINDTNPILRFLATAIDSFLKDPDFFDSSFGFNVSPYERKGDEKVMRAKSAKTYPRVFQTAVLIDSYSALIVSDWFIDAWPFSNLPLPLVLEIDFQNGYNNSLHGLKKDSIDDDEVLFFIFGFFHDQYRMLLSHDEYIHDCHPGNILYERNKEDQISFAWADFGYSFSTDDKSNLSSFNRAIGLIFDLCIRLTSDGNAQQRDILQDLHYFYVTKAVTGVSMKDLIGSVFEKLKNILLTLDKNTLETFSRKVAPHLDFWFEMTTTLISGLRNDLTRVEISNEFLNKTVASQAAQLTRVESDNQLLNKTVTIQAARLTIQAARLTELTEEISDLKNSMLAFLSRKDSDKEL